MNDAERAEYLYGKIDALQGTICALIATHPAPATLLSAMERIWETRIAGHLHAPTTEPFSEGFESATTQFRDVARNAGRP